MYIIYIASDILIVNALACVINELCVIHLGFMLIFVTLDTAKTQLFLGIQSCGGLGRCDLNHIVTYSRKQFIYLHIGISFMRLRAILTNLQHIMLTHIAKHGCPWNCY